MNPEMSTPVDSLAALAIVAWLALGWTIAGGPSRIRARLAKRAGRKR